MQYMLDAQEALFRQMVEGRLSRDQLNQLRSGLRNGASSPTP
jgi:pyruvate dehydrogenase complex dehydrogenase (E1) component